MLQLKSTALIFSSGKIVVAGNKNEYKAKISCIKFVKILKKIGFNVELCDFKIQNIVCSYDMKSLLHLEKIYLYCENFGCYEPELFPGLILRVKKATLLVFERLLYQSLLVFGSGKVVITGLKNYEQVQKVFNDIYPILKMFKRK